MINFPVTKKDLKIEWFSGSGAGGQHRNKHQNCCRITHISSGISAVCQEHRERSANQKKAFRRLANKLIIRSRLEKERVHETTVVRTYNEVDNRVKNHKTKFTQSYKEVMKDPSKIIEDNMQG